MLCLVFEMTVTNPLTSCFRPFCPFRMWMSATVSSGDLLTVQELAAFAQRLQVAQMLSSGKTYEAIRAEIATSSSTITRVNTELRYGSGGYQMVLERLKESPAPKRRE